MRRRNPVILESQVPHADGLAEYVARVAIFSAAGDLLANKGDRCDRVPVAAKGWLLRQGVIERQQPNEDGVKHG